MFDRKIKIAKTPQVITESNFTARENNSTQNEHFNLVKNYTENPSSVLTQIPSDTFTEDMNPNVLKSIDIMNSIDNNDYWVIDTNNCIYTTITNQDNSTFEFLTTLAISSLKKYKKDTGFDIKKVFVENVGIYSKIILKDFNIDIIKNGSYDGVVTLPDIKVTSDNFFYENDTKSFGKTKYELLKDVVTKKESSYILLLNNTFYECLPFGGSSDLSYIVDYIDPDNYIDVKNEMFIDERGIMNFNYTNNTNYSSNYNTSGIKLNQILKPDDNIIKENSMSIGFNDCNFLSDYSGAGYANIQFNSKDKDYNDSLKQYNTIIDSGGLITLIDYTPVVKIDKFGINIYQGKLFSPEITSPKITSYYITDGKTGNFDTLELKDYVTKAYVDYAFGAGNPFDYSLKSYKYNQANDVNNFFEIAYDTKYANYNFSDTKYNIIFRDVTNDRTTILNKKGLFINLKNDGLYVPYTEVSVDKIGIILELDLYDQFKSGSLLTATDLKIGTNESDRITIKKDSIEGSYTIKDYSTLYDKNYIQKKHLEDRIVDLQSQVDSLLTKLNSFDTKYRNFTDKRVKSGLSVAINSNATNLTNLTQYILNSQTPTITSFGSSISGLSLGSIGLIDVGSGITQGFKFPTINGIVNCNLIFSTRITGAITGNTGTARELIVYLRRVSDNSIVGNGALIKINDNNFNARNVVTPSYIQGPNDSFLTGGFYLNILNNSGGNLTMNTIELLIQGS